MRRRLSRRFGLIKERLALIVVAQQRGKPGIGLQQPNDHRGIACARLADQIEGGRDDARDAHRRKQQPNLAPSGAPRFVGHWQRDQHSHCVAQPVDADQAGIRVVDRRAERTDSDLRELREGELNILL